MTDLLPITCHALVCLPTPVADAAATRRVLGRWLGEWQVDYAHDVGCSGLFLLGGGGGAESIATRIAAERQGLKVREIATPHALAGSVAPGELLLVLQPQLLASENDWWRQADHRGLVLTVPAATGVEAGFERIDLSRAWAGALLVPGHAVHRLLELPEDVEAAPALLRIALQAGVPDLRVDDDLVTGGAWPVLGRGVPVRLHEEKWLSRRLAAVPAEGDTFTRRLCQMVLRRWGAALPGKPAAVPLALAASGLLATSGVAVAWYGAGAGGLGLVALAALVLELAGAIATLQRDREKLGRFLPRLRWGVDLAVLGCGYLGIEGRWFRQAFPALVLVLAMNLSQTGAPRRWCHAAVADRALVTALVAIMGLASSVEVGLMLAGMVLLAAKLLPSRG